MAFPEATHFFETDGAYWFLREEQGNYWQCGLMLKCDLYVLPFQATLLLDSKPSSPILPIDRWEDPR